MELPKRSNNPKERDVTGEIMYLNEKRERGEVVDPMFSDIGDLAIQMYNEEADMCKHHGVRPDIMNEYEKYDKSISEEVALSLDLADELLKHKDAESPLTFVDFVVEDSAVDVLGKIKRTRLGDLLADKDEQLAIESDGSYYPKLDARKSNMRLRGVGLRVFGWDDPKVVFTNENEEYEYPKHALVYPEDETSRRREFSISFSYDDKDGGFWNESISMQTDDSGYGSISSNISGSAYMETGYDGHKGVSLKNIQDKDVEQFSKIVADIVGDNPESVGERQEKVFDSIVEKAPTEEIRDAFIELKDKTWTAQALGLIMNRRLNDGSTVLTSLKDYDKHEKILKYIKDSIDVYGIKDTEYDEDFIDEDSFED